MEKQKMYLVCNDVELIQKVLAALPENFDVQIIPRVGDIHIEKEEDARNLANLLNSVHLAEKCAEASYVAGQWNNLINIRANLAQALHKDKWNIKLKADFEKVEHDLKALEPMVNYSGAALNDHLERKYLQPHNKFKFLRTLNVAQPELKAESETSSNVTKEELADEQPKGKIVSLGN